MKLNTEFNKLCDWVVDNKLSIHFGDDKTKSILFSGKNHPKDDKLRISRGRTEVAQHKEINYLGCLFDEKCTGESMALKTIEKINRRLKFMWRKNKFLTPPLKRLLCNALIQPHFDYASSAWYPNLQKNFQINYKFVRTSALDFVYLWETDLTLGFKSLKKEIGIQI